MSNLGSSPRRREDGAPTPRKAVKLHYLDRQTRNEAQIKVNLRRDEAGEITHHILANVCDGRAEFILKRQMVMGGPIEFKMDGLTLDEVTALTTFFHQLHNDMVATANKD